MSSERENPGSDAPLKRASSVSSSVSLPGSSKARTRESCRHLTKRVGKYLVGRTIGEGTYGNVKYSQHSESGTAYALKVLNKDHLVQRGMVDQVKTEIAILKKIKHPFIVNMHEIMSSRDKIFLVMELVTGGDLFDKIAVQGPLKEDEGRYVCVGVGVGSRPLRARSHARAPALTRTLCRRSFPGTSLRSCSRRSPTVTITASVIGTSSRRMY